MSPRKLVKSDNNVLQYEVTDTSGKVIGYDEEPAPGSEIANLIATTAAARAYLGTTTPSAIENARQIRRLTRLVLNLHDTVDP